MNDHDFTILFHRYWGWAVGVASRAKWGRGCDPEDLAADALITLWRWLKTHEEESEEFTKTRLVGDMRDSAREWTHRRRVNRLDRVQLSEWEWEQLPDPEGGE